MTYQDMMVSGTTPLVPIKEGLTMPLPRSSFNVHSASWYN